MSPHSALSECLELSARAACLRPTFFNGDCRLETQVPAETRATSSCVGVRVELSNATELN